MRQKLLAFTAVVISLSAGLVALSFTTRADSGLRSLDARLGLLPADAQMVVSIDLDGLRRSSLYGRYGVEKEKRLEREHPELGTFIAETGLDPRKDLDTLIIASRLGGHGSVLGIVTGRFDPTIIERKLVEADMRSETVSGHKVFRLPSHGPVAPSESDDDRCEVTFLGREAIVFGDGQAVRALLARQESGEGGLAKSSKIQDLLSGVDTTAHVFGVVQTGDVAAMFADELQKEGVPPVLKTLKSVTAMGFSLAADRELAISARATCGKPEDALLVRDAVNGFIAMGKLAAQDSDPELASTLGLAQLAVDGNAVNFTIKVPESVIDGWHKKMEQMHHMDEVPAAETAGAQV